jgi:hypothetical protein
MNETNWSEWIEYDGNGKPVRDGVKTDIALCNKLVEGEGLKACLWNWGDDDITHYRYDLDHPGAPKKPDWDEGERRMRNIASNGGTGEHYGRSDLTWLTYNMGEWKPQYSHAYRSDDNQVRFCNASDDVAAAMSAYRLDQINAERARLELAPLDVPLQYDPDDVAFKPERCTAPSILQAAQSHLQDRAATYDKPEGERSMAATVKAFEAVTGDTRIDTEEKGWLFMALLKAVRSQQGGYRADSYEDGAAYFALMGESAGRDRK